MSLLEPLATALELHVLDLLRGEPAQEQDVETALKEALEAVRQQRRQARKQLWKDCVPIAIILMLMGAFWLACRPPTTDLDHTVTAGIYQNGVLVDYTTVEIQGEVSLNVFNGKRSYWGRFAIECVEWTTRTGAVTGLNLDKNSYSGLIYVPVPGHLNNALQDIDTICSYDMREFAFTLEGEHTEDWVILATSPQMYLDYCTRLQDAPRLWVK